MKVAVTGGAGFIGSHLADALVSEGHEVYVIDNLVTGKQENVNEKAIFMKRDIHHDLSNELEGMDCVFHLAANPDVKSSATDPMGCFEENVSGTLMLLESCRKADVKRIVFASTSTVYGEAKVFPTPESHPCAPISNYGASKLAGEAFVSSYCATYGMKGTSMRFANIYGERSTHGVMYDFYHKLMHDSKRMEILGDGRQEKSYLHVSDCVSGIMAAWKKQDAQYDVFNVGSHEKVLVSEIAALMCRILGLTPELNYTGTPRGWAGDSRLMLLDCAKLKALGWKAGLGFENGVRRYIQGLK
ncbi:NAD-dependent epimerase/dehydratase family protein [Candidatus Micrarchaeota archaeon]|nr:NAD-dependent epimerase/dehydratase family protein [Candidatus Micrarchaeota archaeon]